MPHVVLLVVGMLLVAGQAFAADAPAGEPSDGLRSLADARRLPFGTAFAWPRGFDRTQYEKQTLANFNSVTPEAGLYFRPLQSQRGVWDFSAADEIVEFAQQHHLAARGQHLVWHHYFQKPESLLPDWLVNGNFSKEELAAILRDFITTTVGHFKTRYPGVIRSWCVVNEAALGTDSATFQPSFWYDNLGPSFVDNAFVWAHEADPDAILYYNDWGAEGMGPKSDFVYQLVQGLKARNIPINGVGLQCHFILDQYPGKESIRQNMKRLSDLGLEIYITELDVKIEGGVTEAKLQRQAEIFREMLELCLSTPACKAFTVWGFNDAQSWLREDESATLMNRDYLPKPSYRELKKVLSQ